MEWYKVIKTIKGRRYVYWQKTYRIGRNVKIAADVRASDFSGRVVTSGESVDPRRAPRASRAKPAVASPMQDKVAGAVVGAAATASKRVVTAD